MGGTEIERTKSEGSPDALADASTRAAVFMSNRLPDYYY